jgi:hypothetical protein
MIPEEIAYDFPGFDLIASAIKATGDAAQDAATVMHALSETARAEVILIDGGHVYAPVPLAMLPRVVAQAYQNGVRPRDVLLYEDVDLRIANFSATLTDWLTDGRDMLIDHNPHPAPLNRAQRRAKRSRR